MAKNTKAKTPAARKQQERVQWRKSGGGFKEIKFTKKGLEILASRREKHGFERDWEYINYLLENDCD